MLWWELKHDKISNVNKVKALFVDSYEEIKRVKWPNKQETIRLTAYVIGVSLGVGLFVMLADYLFAELLKLIIN